MSCLYIHFPFCLYKCHYCDFNSHARKQEEIPHQEYFQSLNLELFHRHGEIQNSELQSIFLGGGTPSLMRPQDLEALLAHIQKYFSFSPTLEITMEANPGTVTFNKLKEFLSLGVNRISLGVQSLHNAYLGRFGRIHTAIEALQVVKWLAELPLKSWNVDLIFGFPNQKKNEWQQDIETILSYNPPHLSCYAFTVESDAPYARMVQAGKAQVPDEDRQALMMEWTQEKLSAQPLRAYEISNYARIGHECRHNLSYWNYEEFLGLGAGATSFIHKRSEDILGYRTQNLKKPEEYMAAIRTAQLAYEKELISKKTAMGEFMMMGLRLKKGIDENRFKELFQVNAKDTFRSLLTKYRKRNWMDENRIQLTKEGWLFSNIIMAEFF